MQLVLRQPAARDSGDESTGVVVAASPDTFGREQWQWDVRVTDALCGFEVTVAHNPELIHVVEERIDIAPTYEAMREADELWLLVVVEREIAHGHFRLEAGDVAVWEGEDPIRIRLDAIDGLAVVRLVRITRRDGKAARWVP